MNRRKFIAATTATLGGTVLAGYAGSGDGEDPAPEPANEPTGARTDPETDIDTNTDAPTPTEASDEADVSIVDEGGLGIDDEGFSTYAYYDVIVRNDGDSPSGLVEVVVDRFDEGGNYLDYSGEEIASLNPGQTWEARVYGILVGGTWSARRRPASTAPSRPNHLVPSISSLASC